MNYLLRNVKRGHISPDKEEMIVRLHKLLGNQYENITLWDTLIILIILVLYMKYIRHENMHIASFSWSISCYFSGIGFGKV